MYVIMGSQGEYSDRSVFTLGYTTSEDRAKELVAEFTKVEQLEHSIKDAKSALSIKASELWEVDNPYPTENPPEQPKFDQTKHKDKEYVAAHIERKKIFAQACRDFHAAITTPWYARREEFVNKYVEDNFTMDLCEPPKWTDSQYWYEKIEELK